MKPFRYNFRIDDHEQTAAVFEKAIHRLDKIKILPSQLKSDFKICLVEAIANADRHAGEFKKMGAIRGCIFANRRSFGFEVIDHGPGFKIDKVPLPDFTQLSPGGRGIYLMKQLADEVSYQKKSGKNILTWRRNLAHISDNPELDLLYELSEVVIRRANVDEVYKIVLDRLDKIFGVDRASILVYDEATHKLTLAAGKGMPYAVSSKISIRPGEGISGFVFQHGRPLLVTDIDKDPRGIEKKKNYHSGSFLSAPMVSMLDGKEEKLGVINVTERRNGKPFVEKDLKLLSVIANQAMACIHMKKMIDEVKLNESLRREIDVVRRIQSSYLPDRPPDLEGWHFAGCCEMAHSVGGDYYDFIEKENFLYIIIADVSGHDIRSAMLMLSLRAQLQMALTYLDDPGEVLTCINKTLTADLEKNDMFISALLLRLDKNTSTILMSNAGHYSPLLLDGSSFESNSGLVIGIDSSEKYKTTTSQIAKGQTMLLFTDGVIEAIDSRGHVFGLDRLQATTKKFLGSGLNLTETLVRTIGIATEFRGKAHPPDDLTLVAIQHLI